jgi:hypothetical protein
MRALLLGRVGSSIGSDRRGEACEEHTHHLIRARIGKLILRGNVRLVDSSMGPKFRARSRSCTRIAHAAQGRTGSCRLLS